MESDDLDLDLLNLEALDYINVDSPGSEPTFMSLNFAAADSSTDGIWCPLPSETVSNFSPPLTPFGLHEPFPISTVSGLCPPLTLPEIQVPFPEAAAPGFSPPLTLSGLYEPFPVPTVPSSSSPLSQFQAPFSISTAFSSGSPFTSPDFIESFPASTAPRQLTMEDKPPGVRARDWRRQIKPERCPICNRGHEYKADLSKHVAAQHRDQAAKHNVSTARHVCIWCNKSFARKDHLVRHRRRKHGLEGEQRRRKKEKGSV